MLKEYVREYKIGSGSSDYNVEKSHYEFVVIVTL